MSIQDRAPGSGLTRSPAAAALLPRFLEHRRRDVATLHAALEQVDFETIARLGHNMAGTGPSYGFPELGAIGARLEAEARAGNAAGVLAQLKSIEAFLARIDVER